MEASVLDKYKIEIMISAPLCRAARALLDISQDDLVALSGVSKASIADFERGARNPHRRTLRDLQAALETKGVRFRQDNGFVWVGLSDVNR